MIGAATYTTDWDDVPCWALHEEPERAIDTVCLIDSDRDLSREVNAANMAFYSSGRGPRPNVAGPRQARCHEFPDVLPVEQPEASQDGPGESAEPSASTTPADALPVRGEDAYWRTRWFLTSEDSPIYDWLSDVTSTMQTADRQDMRQDVCMTSWQYSVSSQYRGGRGVPSARSVRTLVERWLKRNGKADTTIAISDTLATSVERYHETMDVERVAITLEVLRREQSRIAAEQAKAKPPAALVFTW